MNKISVAAFLASKGQSVRRCLFGPVDHKQNADFLKKQYELQHQESKQRWNFDFQTMTPLAGKFQWEAIGGEDVTNADIPSAYAMPQLCAARSRPRTPLGLISTAANTNNIVVPVPVAAPAVTKVTKRLDFDDESCCTSTSSCSRTSTDSPASRLQTAYVPSRTSTTVVTSHVKTTARSSQKSSVLSKSVSKKRKLQQRVIPGKFSFFIYLFCDRLHCR